ncbi:MAG: DUF4166 domain-containing protein [Proteobacteria bacterium]|nr:DUF4166 domain-containing protein [Pseudomonadota bacterium]
MSPLRVLILGGYGTFGGRLAKLLSNEENLTLIIAGRSLVKATIFRTELKGRAGLEPAQLDRNENLPSQLAALKPDSLIDASGPFQAYGADPYRVVKACIAAGVHYLDFADSTDFVRGIAEFDAEARAHSVAVISGVSSLPALSFAVARALARGMARVESYTVGIAPSPYAAMGMNVIQAIASYAGKPVRRWRDGKETTARALIEARRFTIAPPAALPLRSRRFALVDVPDLTLAREIFPDLQSSWVGAGTEPVLWHRGLSALAWLARLKLLPSLRPFSKLFHWVMGHWRWGEDRGGMFVSLGGIDAEGRKLKRTWSLVAGGDAGPFVPCLAAQALVKRVLAGQALRPGARTAAKELELSEFDPAFAQLAIRTGILTTRDGDTASLYRRTFGKAYETLPGPIQIMHDGTGVWRASGRSEIVLGRSPLAHLLALVMGFPKAGADVPVTVTFETRNGEEKWTRNFAGSVFSSIQAQGRGRSVHLTCERFGPLTFAMALVRDGGKLRLVIRRWSVFGIAMPRFLGPRGETYESVEDGKFCFHVEVALPVVGLIVRYRGWLVRD